MIVITTPNLVLASIFTSVKLLMIVKQTETRQRKVKMKTKMNTVTEVIASLNVYGSEQQEIRYAAGQFYMKFPGLAKVEPITKRQALRTFLQFISSGAVTIHQPEIMLQAL
jgi:hypothetical protein